MCTFFLCLVLVRIWLLSLPSFLLSVEHPACCASCSLQYTVRLLPHEVSVLFSSRNAIFLMFPFPPLFIDLILCLHDHPYLGDFCFILANLCQVPAVDIELYWLSPCVKKHLSNTPSRMRHTSLSISSHLCCLCNYLGLPHCCCSHGHCFLILALNL